MTEVAHSEIEWIALGLINIANPRVRKRKSFDDIVRNISTVGLKRPVTVARRLTAAGLRYDLVCGQGRLEAYEALGQEEIPAIVIDADEQDCLVRSLVENCARPRHSAVDIFKDIQRMKMCGYSSAEIAQKTGLPKNYVSDLNRLIEHGAERLLEAVEAGHIPIGVAVEIATSDDATVQRALQTAYEKQLLKGRQLMTAKRLLEGGKIVGKKVDRSSKSRGKITARILVATYKKDAERKQVLTRKAAATRQSLDFVTHAMNTLLADVRFRRLLQSQGLATVPRSLAQHLDEGSLAPCRE